MASPVNKARVVKTSNRPFETSDSASHGLKPQVAKRKGKKTRGWGDEDFDALLESLKKKRSSQPSASYRSETKPSVFDTISLGKDLLEQVELLLCTK